ncbi:MAG: hypothetical protein IKJ13_06580 [Clostridia bacterium]|nr:hypothetical protein [Clostridia bacterium]
MKNNTSKIALIILSLALLVGAAIGFSVSAETAAPEIVSKNIDVNGNYCLMLAVDPATVAGDDVTITIYEQLPAEGVEPAQTITKAKTATEKIDLDHDGTAEYDAIVFYTAGVSAKDIADVWYITTTSGGVTSDAETYSVREYAFERLYKNGTVTATETDEDLKAYYQKQFYLELLDVGSAAQQLLVNYNKIANGETPEKLAKEYIYAAVTGGTYTVDGVTASKGFVNAGDVLTLTADDESVTGWNVVTYGKNGGQISTQPVAIGDTLTVSGNTVVVPYKMGVTPGKYFDEIGDSMYSFETMNSTNFVETAGGVHYLSKAKFTTSGDFLYSFKDSGDEERGKVLSTSKAVNAGGQALLSAPIISKSDKANCIVFEYDFMYTGADFYYSDSDINNAGSEMFTEPFVVTFNKDTLAETQGKTNSTLTKTQWVNFRAVDYDKQLTNNANGNYGSDALRLPGATDKTYDILPNTWHRITYEVYTDVGKLVVYFDGNVVSVSNAGSAATSVDNINSISFTWDWRVRNCEMMFDNMVGVKIEKQFTLGN